MSLQKIVLGGGCFWCLDAAYRRVKGVESVTAGYAGGEFPNPTYEQVSGGQTGHTEVVEVKFDPKIINLEQILDIFWTIHDPTQKDRQGGDIGPQYRSAIYYLDESQKTVIDKSLAAVKKLWPKPIQTEIKPLDKFYPAESYHQDYFAKNPTAAYCQIVINPKLKKLREHHQKLLKD